MALITKTLEGKHNSTMLLVYNPKNDTATVNLAWSTDRNYWTEVEDLNKVLQTGTLRIAGPFSHRGNVTLEQHEIEWLVSSMESIAEEVGS